MPSPKLGVLTRQAHSDGVGAAWPVAPSTLASTIAFGELLYTAKTIAEDQMRPLETYTAVTLIFTAVLLPVSYFFIWLERRMASRGGQHRE